MALSGRNTAVTTDEAKILDAEDDGGLPTTIVVRNLITSAADVIIRIPELHGDSGGATIIPGDFQPFRVDDAGIKEVYASTPSDSATIHFWVAARTRQR